MLMKHSQEWVWVGHETVCDSRNFQHVGIGKTGWGGSALTVLLDSAGAAKMQSATAVKSGLRMAVLVDGDLFAAPMVREPLSDMFELSLGFLSDDELEHLAEVVGSMRTVQ